MTNIKLFKESEIDAAAMASGVIIGFSKNDAAVKLASSITAPEFVAECESALKTLRASDKTAAVTTLTAPSYQDLLVFAVGLGTEPDLDELRQIAGVGIRAAAGLEEVTVALPHSTNAELEAISEGALLGAYDFTRYRSDADKPVSTINIHSTLSDVESIIERSSIIAQNVNSVRDLVNTPANDLNTESFAQYALTEAQAAGCSVHVYDLAQLHKEKLAGLIAVGQGSANEPKLVRIEWNPSEANGFTALVGKGIMFDTGGYSLKPSSAITEMKTDMGGAATILHAVITAARLKLPTKVVGWMCLAENMISGKATRPDDVIVYRNGVSVEINNTDAEGRLVLADGLIMATDEEPDAVIDVATLTGAQMVALGERYTGIMGTDETREEVLSAAQNAGELAWGMPLPEHLKSSLKSDIADMKNTGSRYGGMLTAGLFLQRFVGDIPWAHIDIAGPSFNREGAYGYTPKGATGTMMRTLVHYLEEKALEN
ncbi:leucyl aminopeptidase [Arcanobacterium bovis]|uniref:Probable cytosol aminopeptidase n=1 Tax=Arcanobacterium bovis TaxID=2529275 RepID=A0A4Q9V1A7_9ACTO|nr:leucyl aminopeptidase [Arcanobacterium bovis]TBW22823.1 leucyl aminopeptidase [Arcanobacterium bovis]